MPTVLIIQSDPIARNLLRDILSRNGFTVLDAVSDAEAVELLRMLSEEAVDLLIDDHASLSAGSLVAEMESLRPEMKILLTLPANPAPSVTNGAVLPGTAVLQHPFTEPRLLAAVSAVLRPTTQ